MEEKRTNVTKKSEPKKGMKKNEKRLILILLIILVIVVAIAVARNNSSSEEEEATGNTVITEKTVNTASEVGEYTTLLSDGSKLNISEELNKDITLGGLEITDIQLTESGNITQVLATITNVSEETDGGYVATLTLYDDEGNVLIEMNPYIAGLEPGESTSLNANAVLDYSDAYSMTITR